MTIKIAIPKGWIAAALALALVATLPAGIAHAQETADAVASSRDWSVHAPTDTPIKMCYVSSAPIDTQASRTGIRRGDPYLLVSNFPEQGVTEQVSVTLGFPANGRRPIELRVDNRTFKMSAEGQNAWLNSPADDRAAVAAMRAGSKASVTATSTRGTRITDEYSLIGFTAATKRSSELCQ
ncbi:MAG: invasion associated locus B family protein [Pseudomonadota bacterium]